MYVFTEHKVSLHLADVYHVLLHLETVLVGHLELEADTSR